MLILNILGWIVYLSSSFYLLFLIARMILDWAQFFAPQWRPRGLLLVGANILYRLTDPPLKALRKSIPPLRLGGGVALDVGFMVVFFIAIIGQWCGRILIVL